MKRKVNVYFVVVLIVVVIILGLFLYSDSSENATSPLYQKFLSDIEEGNQYVIENNLSDGCFSYRYFHRGCYYDLSKRFLVISNFIGYNLTHSETIDLCYRFAHKGATAYCLKSNNEIQKCYDFASDNIYLNRICNLGEEEIIPSKNYGPYQTGNLTDKVDSWETMEPVYYSDLI